MHKPYVIDALAGCAGRHQPHRLVVGSMKEQEEEQEKELGKGLGKELEKGKVGEVDTRAHKYGANSYCF